jgi:hypothetical protein
MHYRWNKANFPFIYEEFGKVIVPNMPRFIRAFLGKKIGAKFKSFVPFLGITDKSIPAIEDWYENHVLPLLDKHFAKYDYLLGSKPCLGDFGLMGPLYAHLYRDPAPGVLMKKVAPNVARWVERMNQPQDVEGTFLADDVIPDTLLILLSRIFNEQWPVLINTVNSLDKWIDQNTPVKVIPRTIGEHTFTLDDITEKRAISTFHQWKVQRIVDCYHQFDSKEKLSVDTFLQSVGGLHCMQLDIKKRLSRIKNKLVLSD